MPNFTGIDLTGAILNDRFGVTKYKTADEPLASSTTYQNDDQLFGWSVLANAVYELDLHIVYQAAVAAAFKNRFVLPAGATVEGWDFTYDAGTTEMAVGTLGTSNAEVTGLPGTAGNVPYWVRGTLHVGATAGTVDWQWAQNTSNATATIVRKGSRCTLRRID